MISLKDSDSNRHILISLIISISVIAVAIILPLLYNPSYPQDNWHKVFCQTLKQQIQYDKKYILVPRSIVNQEISNYEESCIIR